METRNKLSLLPAGFCDLAQRKTYFSLVDVCAELNLSAKRCQTMLDEFVEAKLLRRAWPINGGAAYYWA